LIQDLQALGFELCSRHHSFLHEAIESLLEISRTLHRDDVTDLNHGGCTGIILYKKQP
jgi:hypothetical protein